MQNLTILGATGSIGASTLKVVSENPSAFNIYALVGGKNVTKMAELCAAWQPQFAVLNDEADAKILKAMLVSGSKTQVLSGPQAMCDVSSASDVDMVMAAIVGAAGLLPTLAAVKAGKRVLLANKEALVMSGQLFIDAVREHNASLLPVDSEHNAIFQCLPTDIQTNLGHCQLADSGINHILLTGSGGPFRYTDIAELASKTPAQAIAHPNWSMGPKISVDSATMMNKGLEFIEARWLFNTSKDQLKVIIHPQSVIHSMVQYNDGSVLAQMGQPDMATPIAYSMSYPDRIPAGVAPLDFTKVGELTFLEPDYTRYPCLALAMEACFEGQHATTAINAANEIAVEAFLSEKIRFTEISSVNERVMSKVCASNEFKQLDNLETILEVDRMARSYAQEIVRSY
ncbi:1-deoxy-D-xylulose-5-phosphate reductoisomerase [Vibrio sp. SCSIO 43140]|uniref:1-deoxy-D-xylulose-5-phosphate reductoisomerase n=1 Tax=Vibrio sp. SCSIO 43140 TaxID=2819100 RepID=UPI002075A160|nr:1-deoxy-D-xylulose-5-phosphate reductoisomerase [Vibrio sp. SCSIO 43140]USD61073.1 1-deoxy-D-xylulose-5-phosphate reductoisomerase [Vibrio sp. SCSIO 43140]